MSSVSQFPFSLLKNLDPSEGEPDATATIRVGNDVWIGTNAIVIGQVAIGDGAVIAAGAVVRSDVEPYTIVGGVPARVIGRRFSEEDGKRIQGLAWWNWSDRVIAEREALLRSGDIVALERLCIAGSRTERG